LINNLVAPNYQSVRLKLSAKSASQQCFSLKKNQSAVLLVNQISPSEHVVYQRRIYNEHQSRNEAPTAIYDNNIY
jgi:hypothetical protein